MATVEWPGFGALQAAAASLRDPDMGPLMERWERTIVEGNRRGVLAGLDGNNVPMPPLKYRNGAGRNTADRQGSRYGKLSSRTPKARGVGFRPYAAGFDENLSTREYQRLTGPRLAPRRLQSRVITHLYTEHGQTGPGEWYAVGAWFDVVSKKGVPFLMAHFEPRPGSKLPRYDLRPVRPEDQQQAAHDLETYAAYLIREALG